jgi:hypothetical protein
MENHNEPKSFIDILMVWLGTLIGHITLSDAVLWITLIYTVCRTYVLIRDEFFRKSVEPR